MKKFILPYVIIIPLFFLAVFATIFFLPQKTNAQAEPDCRKIFDRESYQCLKDFNACSNACLKETEKPDGTSYINSGEIYPECMKASDCSGKSSACDEQALANFRACGKSDDQPKAAEAKKETPAQTETEARFANLLNFDEWPNPRDLIHDYLVREAARFDVRAPGYWEIKPEDFVISRGAPKPEVGNIWIVEPRTKVWVQAKGEKEYKPFDFKTTLEPGSYIKTETPVDFWVRGVGLVQFRPGPSGSGMFAVEEINGKISPFLLLGEMEVQYGKPIEEATQKPVDWEQIKFIVKTPNSSVTVSRTHYLVRYDEKENETTVAVLEGEVEVVPNVGEPVTVAPKDGEPGVAVITQKLSTTKLALAGLVLVVIIGGGIFLLKRKFTAKGFSKKKR